MTCEIMSSMASNDTSTANVDIVFCEGKSKDLTKTTNINKLINYHCAKKYSSKKTQTHLHMRIPNFEDLHF